MPLADWGWNRQLSDYFKTVRGKNLVPGRILLEQKDRYHLMTEHGACNAVLAGKLRHQTKNNSDRPVVGDWVAVQRNQSSKQGTICQRLPRRTQVSRKQATGRKNASANIKEQVIAANVDIIFIVFSLDRPVNLSGLERYLALVTQSGAKPVIVLNKSDRCDHPEKEIRSVQQIAPETEIYACCALSPRSVRPLHVYFKKGVTIALLGPSGAGKSTLINQFLGYDRQKVQQVSDTSSKGRHTTTTREIIQLPKGGLMMDNPGMRELHVWDNSGNWEKSYPDIDALAGSCKFKDCRHQKEPDCAVRDAVEQGFLKKSRYHNYLKIKDELKLLQIKKERMKKS